MRLEAFSPARRHATIAAAFIVLAIVLGGGGSPNPATEFWLELLAGLAALAWLWLPGPLAFPRARSIWLLAGLAAIVPLVQLVPLPPALWQSLPGREHEVAALALIGQEHSWRPLTTSPARTLASLLSLVPPVALMLAASALAAPQRRILVGVVACMALVSALFGAMQLAAGPTALRLYEFSNPLVVTGFQANRNAEVDVLLIGMLALVAFAAEYRPQPRGTAKGSPVSRSIWLAAFALILALAGIMTASRAGILLLLPTIVACWAILAPGLTKSRNRLLGQLALGVAGVAALGGLLLRHNAALQTVAARFSQVNEGRPELWRDTLYAIGQHWPFGSGMGTFVPTFIGLEPLEVVDATVPNRAHNDFLELALEAGGYGIAALALAVAVTLYIAFRAWKGRPAERAQILFAVAALAVVAAHSLVDYPMRSLALACLAALAAGLLAPLPGTAASDPEPRPASRGRTAMPARIVITIVLLGYMAAAWGNGLDRRSSTIMAIEHAVPGPFRAAADQSAAAIALTRGETKRALAHAEAAVNAEPVSPLSASLLGAARQVSGDAQGAQAAFRVSAMGGWRDPLTQLYWYGIALEQGDAVLAAQRVDALLRTDPHFPAGSALLQPLEASAAGQAALADRLAEGPGWAREYMNLHYSDDPALVRTRSLVLARVGARHPFGCEMPYSITATLIARGMRPEAVRIWQANCNDGEPGGLLSDASFALLAKGGRPSPFGWSRNSNGDVSVEIVGQGGGTAVHAHNSASVAKWLLSQPAPLTQGRYRLRAKVSADGGAAPGRVVASLDCDGIRRPPVAPVGDLSGSGQVITAGTCASPVLTLWLRPGNGDVTIRGLAIERAD